MLVQLNELTSIELIVQQHIPRGQILSMDNKVYCHPEDLPVVLDKIELKGKEREKLKENESIAFNISDWLTR